MEHSIVNKYSDMITEEVNRYKNEMLDYFHARQIYGNKSNIQDSSSPSSSSSSSALHQYYTTSLTRTTYELEGYINNELNFTQPISVTNDDDDEESKTLESTSDDRSHVKSILYDQDQSQIQTVVTQDPTTTNEINPIPFYQAFRIPSNLVNSVMLK
jgi:hypothetical protein